ncbi:MAG: hypothetical protein J2P21_08820 [Chloracidobacterium sp.]|nr:hypothetical protein [Chloracidobacterium sp.]
MAPTPAGLARVVRDEKFSYVCGRPTARINGMVARFTSHWPDGGLRAIQSGPWSCQVELATFSVEMRSGLIVRIAGAGPKTGARPAPSPNGGSLASIGARQQKVRPD